MKLLKVVHVRKLFEIKIDNKLRLNAPVEDYAKRRVGKYMH